MCLKSLPIILLLSLFSGSLIGGETNSKFTYLQNGQPIAPWTASTGNKADWYVPFSGFEGKTSDGDFIITRSQLNLRGQAIMLNWKSEKGVASFTISGPVIDLTAMENHAALAFDILLESKVKGSLAVSMGCSYPCKGTVQLKTIFKKKPLNSWITFPIPLNCFSSYGAELSKIDSPFIIESNKALKIHINNIRLIQLPEGEKGCAE